MHTVARVRDVGIPYAYLRSVWCALCCGRQAYTRASDVDHGTFVSSYAKRVLYQLDGDSESDGEI